jgi:hypothetical protein
MWPGRPPPAANGSLSTRALVGVVGKLPLRPRGGGLWSEFRTRWGADVGEGAESMGVLGLNDEVETGGGGACLEGRNGSL